MRRTPKKMAEMIVMGVGKKPAKADAEPSITDAAASEEEAPDDGTDPGELSAASEFLKAVKDGDEKGVLAALKTVIETCYPELGGDAEKEPKDEAEA